MRHLLVERDERLHRALAVGALVADDDGAAVILQRGGDDLRGGGAHLVDHDDERPVVNLARVLRPELVDVAVGAADLHHRLVLDEEAGQVDRLVEQAAAVVAEVEDDAGDVFLLQALDELGARRRAVLL